MDNEGGGKMEGATIRFVGWRREILCGSGGAAAQGRAGPLACRLVLGGTVSRACEVVGGREGEGPRGESGSGADMSGDFVPGSNGLERAP